MKNTVLNGVAVGMRKSALDQRSGRADQPAPTGDVWQFWLDRSMLITAVLLPRGADFGDFPCGENAVGNSLFDALQLDPIDPYAVAFKDRFYARTNIRNAILFRSNASAKGAPVIVSGTLINDDHGEFVGYRCTISEASSPSMQM